MSITVCNHEDVRFKFNLDYRLRNYIYALGVIVVNKFNRVLGAVGGGIEKGEEIAKGRKKTFFRKEKGAEKGIKRIKEGEKEEDEGLEEGERVRTYVINTAIPIFVNLNIDNYVVHFL